MPRSGGRRSAKRGDKAGADPNQQKKDVEKDNPFVYKILSESQTKQLLELDVDAIEKELTTQLKYDNYETDLLEASQLDYFVCAVWWAKEQGFTVPQTSAFFTAAHILLMNIKDMTYGGEDATNSEKHMHILDNLGELREMVAGVGQPDSEASSGLDCFSLEQAASIADYFHKTIFQHYRLYQFVFSHTQAEEVIGLDLTCELVKPADVPYPPPLTEGLPHDVWEKYVKTPPPSPTPEDQAELERQRAEQEEVERQQKLVETREEYARENDILSQLTREEIEQVVSSVTKSTFKYINTDIAHKLRERENGILGRINKLHKVASS